MRLRTRVKHFLKKVLNKYVVMFIMFFGLLIIITAIMLVNTVQGLGTDSWIGVEGTIYENEKASKSSTMSGIGHSRGGSSGYSLSVGYTAIEYFYKVQGKVYTNDVISYKSWQVNDKYKSWRKNNIQVYYNPSNPQSSVLERGIDIGSFYDNLFAKAAFMMAAAGLLMLLAMYFGR